MAYYMDAALSHLLSYPETSPFQTDPPLYNLTPEPARLEYDTPELRQAIAGVAKRVLFNILYVMYGTNPLVIVDENTLDRPLPMPDYPGPPPPLPEISLPEDVTFLEQINPTGNTPMFKISVAGKIMLLKAFPNDKPDDDDDDDDDPYAYRQTCRRRRLDEEHIEYHVLFERERDAYAHLIHRGVCAKGIVPTCYGWLTLSPHHTQRTQKVSHASMNVTKLLGEHPPHALLLEFLDGAERLSIANVTEQIADTALRNLYEIHAAYVYHGDVHPRNILVLPDGRVVWIDFDHARCASDPKLWRSHLFKELEECWGYLYGTVLPNKRINWEDPWW